MQNKRPYSPRGQRSVFLLGLKDGLPIGFGYFAVSFSLGIAAKNAGVTAFQGFLASLLTNASAGEYAVFTLIAAGAGVLETFIMTVVANARYLLMSCALSQKFSEDTPIIHRLIVGFDITDEVFGVTILRPGKLNPYYTYGAMTSSIPFWAFGTMFGVIMGNLLPLRIVSALSVALYGMFLAVIIPPTKTNKVVAALVIISFALSFFFSRAPFLSFISDGTKTIILTVAISAIAALLFPTKEEAEDE